MKPIDWYWVAIFTAVLHQVYVWLCWRLELHKKGLTTLLGPGAFSAFAFGFAVIGITRVVAVFVLAYVNQGSVALNPFVLKIASVARCAPSSRQLLAHPGPVRRGLDDARLTWPRERSKCLGRPLGGNSSVAHSAKHSTANGAFKLGMILPRAE